MLVGLRPRFQSTAVRLRRKSQRTVLAEGESEEGDDSGDVSDVSVVATIASGLVDVGDRGDLDNDVLQGIVDLIDGLLGDLLVLVGVQPSTGTPASCARSHSSLISTTSLPARSSSDAAIAAR